MRTLLKTVAAISLLVGCVAIQAQYREQYIEESKSWGSAVADFNRDGHDDFLISGHDSDDRIWYWSSSGYVPSLQVLEWVDRHDCDAADVNADGLPDIYCTIGAEKGLGMGYNELWIQQKDGTFVKSTTSGAEDPYGRGRLPIFFDMNHDAYPDIYLTNLATIRPDGKPNINRVFVNQAGNGFSEITTIATGVRGAQCVAKGDINQDGWDDLLVCYEKGIGHLYLNNKHGDFDELMSPALSGEWTAAKLADMNDDGRDDLVLITDTNVFQIWLNSGKGKYFESPSFERQLPGVGAALGVGDFNHDHYTDVYVALDDTECRTSGHDLAPDIIYYGRSGGGWRKGNLTQDYYGCGHLVDVLDGHKVLLENGGIEYRGPNYIIDWPK